MGERLIPQQAVIYSIQRCPNSQSYKVFRFLDAVDTIMTRQGCKNPDAPYCNGFKEGWEKCAFKRGH